MVITFQVDPETSLGEFLRHIPKGMRSQLVRAMLERYLQEKQKELEGLLAFFGITSPSSPAKPREKPQEKPQKKKRTPPEEIIPDPDPLGKLVV